MKTKSTLPVSALVATLKHQKEVAASIKKQEEIRKETAKKIKEDNEIGDKLVERFKHRYFNLDSSNMDVARVIANIDEYSVMSSGENLVNHWDNPIFRNYLDALAKKFNIRISVLRVKPDDYWSGSGDDMVYYPNPVELRVFFYV